MIADDFPEVTVLFADVVGFTPLSAAMSPPELVGLPNAVFTTFEGFVVDLGLEKIKTVGDEYMVAGGVPIPREDHAEAIAELALRIRDHVAHEDFDGDRIVLRIGINSGPVVAGIIGTHRFSHDRWGTRPTRPAGWSPRVSPVRSRSAPQRGTCYTTTGPPLHRGAPSP